MSLEAHVETLKSVADDAKAIVKEMQSLAADAKKVTKAQKSRIARLASKLDDAAKQGARERRARDIKALTEFIETHEMSLSVVGLPKSVRDEIRADLMAKRARRARLRAQEATDFGGIQSKSKATELDALVKAVKRDTAKKQLAQAFLTSVVKIADVAITIAGKIAN